MIPSRTLALTVLLLAIPAPAAERLPETKPLMMPKNIVAAHQKQITNYFQLLLDREEIARRKQVETNKLELKNKAALLENIRNRLGMPAFGKTEKAGMHVFARSPNYQISRVAIPLNGYLTARGLLFTPNVPGKKPVVIVSPDANSWPERFTGLEAGQKTPAWLARLLGHGTAVYVPQSVERLRDHPYC